MVADYSWDYTNIITSLNKCESLKYNCWKVRETAHTVLPANITGFWSLRMNLNAFQTYLVRLKADAECSYESLLK